MFKLKAFLLAVSGILFAPDAFSQGVVDSSSSGVENSLPASAPDAGEIEGIPYATAVTLGLVGAAIIVSARDSAGTTGTTGTTGTSSTSGT